MSKCLKRVKEVVRVVRVVRVVATTAAMAMAAVREVVDKEAVAKVVAVRPRSARRLQSARSQATSPRQ